MGRVRLLQRVATYACVLAAGILAVLLVNDPTVLPWMVILGIVAFVLTLWDLRTHPVHLDSVQEPRSMERNVPRSREQEARDTDLAIELERGSVSSTMHPHGPLTLKRSRWARRRR
jgi:anti-sigma-K factor RskA